MTDLWFVTLANLHRLTRCLFEVELCLNSESARSLTHRQTQPLKLLSNQTVFDRFDCFNETHQTLNQLHINVLKTNSENAHADME